MDPLASRPVTQLSAAVIGLEVLTSSRASAEAIAQRQQQRLAQLLMSAASNTRFYRAALQGQDPAQLPLRALPVMDKHRLMADLPGHVSDPAITLASLRAFLADPGHIGQPYLGRYWAWESSGSTGQPGIFVQDSAAMAVYDALEASRRHSPRPWARLLDPFYLAERFALVGAIDGHFASIVSAQRLRGGNPWLAGHSRNFSILQPLPTLLSQLDQFGPSILATYPSAAVLLAEQSRRGMLRLPLKEVWTGGETLTPGARHAIEHGLGCPLRNSYGASEFLPIAWECDQGQLHVNADWVILEAVDARHRPVPPGSPSHTTLLTNLANHLQPLIRFDIGDRIVLGARPCACGSALPVVQVEGRTDDALTLPGADGIPVMLLPLALSTLLEDQAGVFDFQLQALGPSHWRLTLGCDKTLSAARRACCRSLLAGFARQQGAIPPHIETRLAQAIPAGRSGKRQRIVAAPPAARGTVGVPASRTQR